MKIKVYTVDVVFPRWSKRVAALGAISAAVALAVVAAVRAAPASVPNTFADGDTLSATKMNANFSALASQLDATNGALATVQQTMVAPDANGNVGIGTKSPTEKLEVVGSGAGGRISWGDGTRKGYLYSDSNVLGIGTYTNHDLIFFTNFSPPQMTLSTTGARRWRRAHCHR
jgi:hypothetical protein